MKIFTDHRWTIGAGFVLTLILVAIGVESTLSSGGQYSGIDPYGLVRWSHFLAGITWIGLLYYFNFVQVPSLGGVSADTKADLFKEGSIVRRALWWFRWGAMFTLIFGLLLYMNLGSAAGWDIRIGAAFGIIMWFNVWFIIWPAQKKIIGIEEADADEKAAAGKRALIASRTNTLLSIPMLFFMASSAHFPVFG
ncbi:MAG: urate hydroxylase PuuD [Mariprofundaceae bacterium]|nr:urate hydroxylase PuuD [Mariprofundaceae bacterium]